MRSGGVLVALILALGAGFVLGAGESGLAAPRERSEARVGAPLAPVAPARTDDSVVAADANERVPAPRAAVPATLQELVARLRAGERLEAELTRGEIVRLFDRRNDGDAEPGAAHTFVDLDGDGATEVFAVIDGGWWGRQLDVFLFAPRGERWSVVDRWRYEGAARGTPGLRTVDGGARRQVAMTWVDGWGTGYSRSTARRFEYCEGKLVEVLAFCAGGEEIHGGSGPVIEWRVGDLALQAEGQGTVASAALDLTYWAGEFGDELSSVDGQVRLRWRQLASGAPFFASEPLDGSAEMPGLWRLGARLWLAQNATAARAFVAGTEAQRESLRRSCDLALEEGPFAPATELAALLPPRPERR